MVWYFNVLLVVLFCSFCQAQCGIDYQNNEFSIDFSTEIQVAAGVTNLPLGSFANYRKNVNVTFDITRDPLCSDSNSKCDIYSKEDSSFRVWTGYGVAKYTYVSQFLTSPTAFYATARSFTVGCTACPFSVKAKSLSYDPEEVK